MRGMFLFFFLANIMVTVIGYFMMPHRMATHFGGGGVANGWTSREMWCVISLVIDIPLFALLWYMPAVVFAFPPGLVNLPNKNYWLAEEHREETRRKLGSLMAEFGAAFFAFFLAVSLLVLDANRSDPVVLNEPLFLGALVVFLGFTLFWTVRIYRAFRVPAP